MIRMFLTAAGLTLALASIPAHASDDDVRCNGPREQWMSVDAAKAKGIELGYDVRRVKEEDGCYEIYAIDKNGAKVELYLDPVTGDVVRSKSDD